MYLDLSIHAKKLGNRKHSLIAQSGGVDDDVARPACARSAPVQIVTAVSVEIHVGFAVVAKVVIVPVDIGFGSGLGETIITEGDAIETHRSAG